MIAADSALWLYGSHARGDSVVDSDVDVLLIGNATEQDIRAACHIPAQVLSVSRYSWNEVERMAASGSLFLLHIRREGTRICEGDSVVGRLRDILDSIQDYQFAQRDIAAFRECAADVRAALASSGSIPFELSVLGTIMRHASVLGCYLLDRPTFGRIAPIQVLSNYWGLDPSVVEVFKGLYAFRLAADGRCPLPKTPTLKAAFEKCDLIEFWVDKLEELTHDDKGAMSKSNRVDSRVS